MSNPWEGIDLISYEQHMSLASVMQLQTMNVIMRDQFRRYPVTTAMILGIAGGNGLNQVDRTQLRKVYGVDINRNYLQTCVERWPELQDVFQPIRCDLQREFGQLPETELLIANLLIEYVGYDIFRQVVQQVHPAYVSCVIQVNETEGFVSDSPYLHIFDGLEAIHHPIDQKELSHTMEGSGYHFALEERHTLPNGKALLRLDFERNQ